MTIRSAMQQIHFSCSAPALAARPMQPGRRRLIAEIDKRPSYDPSGVVGDKPQPAVPVKERETKSPRIFINATLAAACKSPLMHEPANLDRLKAEVLAYNARVDLNDAVTLNL